MTYKEFLDHIVSLDEYQQLRKRKKSFREVNFTIVVPLKVSVEIGWGLNEPTANDTYVDSYVHDHERRVYFYPVVQAKIAEQKIAIRAYLKDMKALVRREAKKAGVRVQSRVDEFDPTHKGIFDMEDILTHIA